MKGETLSYEDKKTRVPHILSYLAETSQRQKLLHFLRDSKQISCDIADRALHIPDCQFVIEIANKEVKTERTSCTCVVNGSLLFRDDPKSKNMTSLGKGNYSVPLSLFDTEHKQTYIPLPNGLYAKPTPSPPSVCCVEIRPAPLFHSFHASCGENCEVAPLLVPYPNHLCRLMKEEIQKHTSQELVVLRVNMTLEQSRTAIKGEEQYGFLFSNPLITIDEMFEKGPETCFLEIHMVTCFAPSLLPPMEALEQLGIYTSSLGPRSSSSSVVFVLVGFPPFTSVPSVPAAAPSLPFLAKKNIKIILVELKTQEFETWLFTRQFADNLGSLSIQL